MANTCVVCNKGYMKAQNIRRKQSGGWALRAPKTKRRQYPNLRPYRIDGKLVGKICMKCYHQARSS